MYRKQLIDLLTRQAMSVRDIAELMEISVREVSEDIEHLRRSLRHSDLRLTVEPARCRGCGFVFRRKTIRRPGKCPDCKSTWIREPVLGIAHR